MRHKSAELKELMRGGWHPSELVCGEYKPSYMIVIVEHQMPDLINTLAAQRIT